MGGSQRGPERAGGPIARRRARSRLWSSVFVGLRHLVLIATASVLVLPGVCTVGLRPASAQNVPTVTAVSPTAGPSSGGTTVTITGTGFVTPGGPGSTTVSFGPNLASSVPATQVSCTSSTTCTAVSPGAPGNVSWVLVTTSAGTSDASWASEFTYVAPSVTGIGPTAGSPSGGSTVTITGSGFTIDSTVKFGSVPATGVSCSASNTCTATSPAGSGTVDVTVTTPNGTSAIVRSDQFSYGAPTITSITPSVGPPGGGTTATITGTNLTPDATFRFGTGAATSANCPSADSCTALSPPGTGTVDVVVTTPGGSSGLSPADRFSYSGTAITTLISNTASFSVSCPIDRWCGAAGAPSGSQYDTLASGPAGNWAPQIAPIPAGVSSNASGLVGQLACPAVGVCWGAGYYHDPTTNTGQPVIYSLSNGAWQASKVSLPAGGGLGGGLSKISCPSSTSCVAAGLYYDPSGLNQGLLITMSSGSTSALEAPSPQDEVSGFDQNKAIRSLSCPADGWCVAVEQYSNTAGNLRYDLLNLSAGTWTIMNPTSPPSGTQADLIEGATCPALGWCLINGSYSDNSGEHHFLETFSNGTWSSTDTPLPPDAPQGALLDGDGSISCAASQSCVATGYYGEHLDPVDSFVAGNTEMLTLANGTWSAVTLGQPPGADLLTVGPIACSQPGICTAAAGYSQSGGGTAVVLRLASGGWTMTNIRYQAGLDDISCSSTSWCAATGTSDAFVQFGGAPTQIALTSSANPVYTGSSVTYTAQVSPVPDGGTVSFNVSTGSFPCNNEPVDSATGQATCTVSYSYPGTALVTASYFGDSNYAETGPSQTFSENIDSPPTASGCPTGITHFATGEPWAVAAMTATVNGHLCAGYWVVTRTGGVTAIGAATWQGDMTGHALNAAMIGIAATSDGKGYYLLGGDGGIFTYGDAVFHGSTGGKHLNAPVVAMAVTPAGDGYWLAASDGGIFTFGNAPFYGSKGGQPLNKPVVGMSADNLTGGYWLVASDGGIFTFNTPFYGSMGGKHLNQPVVGMSPQPDGHGYRMVASDGGVFDFGDATFYGSLPGQGVQNPQVTTMASSVDGNGYYLINGAGNIWAFGDAPYLGNA